MKRVSLLLLTAALCLSLCSCSSLLKKAKAYVTGVEESEMPSDYITSLKNEEYEYDLYKSYVKLTSYIGESPEVTLPTEIDGKPVTVIGSLCFFETVGVTSVVISDSITTIEESAFYYCDKLTAITIPDTVTKLGSRAFAWCNALESVSIGSGISEIPDYCFNHCSVLTTVDIPSEISDIGLRAFSYCEKLADILIPSTVSEIKERAFAGCSSLEFITFENDSVILGKNLFDESEKVVVIAADESNGKSYCAEYGLRWSTSKSIKAIVLENEDNSENA